MSVAIYIQKLKDTQDISYMQLAKDIGISYQNMMDLKNDRIAFISPTVLKKLSKYENRLQEDILFDILKDDVSEDYSLLTLKYLCSKYIEGYSISINANVPNPLVNGQMTFEGTLLKKRTGNNYIAVDSWQKIRYEHWNIVNKGLQIPFSKDSYADVFVNEPTYIANVISWAVQRIIVSNDKSIKGYDILFDKEIDDYIYPLVTSLLVKYSAFKVNLLLI
ncbi:helix-turn-helix domain-containing protein [Thomasclavelia sp.]